MLEGVSFCIIFKNGDFGLTKCCLFSLSFPALQILTASCLSGCGGTIKNELVSNLRPNSAIPLMVIYSGSIIALLADQKPAKALMEKQSLDRHM